MSVTDRLSHLANGVNTAVQPAYWTVLVVVMPADVCDVAKEAIQSKFHLPLSVASTQLGVSQSYLKRLCRTHGIPRWPFRQVSRAQHADPRHKLTVHCPYSQRLPYMY